MNADAAGEKEVQALLKNMLTSLTQAVELTGYVNPMNKVYALSKNLDHMSMFFALLSIYSQDHLFFNPHNCSLMQRSEKFNIDGPPFIVGILTIFKQFHP